MFPPTPGLKSCQKGATRGGEERGNACGQHEVKECLKDTKPLEFTYAVKHTIINTKPDIKFYQIIS